MRRIDRSMRKASSRRRGGAMLFEVMVSLTMLGLIGAGWIGLMTQLSRDIGRTQERERETREASWQLRRMMVWSEQDFNLHVGMTKMGRLGVTIVRTAPFLYAVDVRDATTSVSLLRTTLYVPSREAARATR